MIFKYYLSIKKGYSTVFKPKRWEEYRDFFQMIILRYLVLWFSIVPLIASFLSSINGPVHLSIGNEEIILNFSLPFTWQLLWLSSFFFVLAFAIYKVRCPSFIIKYHNYGDYQKYRHSHRWLVWEASFLLKKNIGIKKFTERLSEKKYLKELENRNSTCSSTPIIAEEFTYFDYKFEDKSYRLQLPLHPTEFDKNKLVDIEIFYEIYGRYSESNCIARWLIKTLLFLSLVFFLATFLEHIYSGMKFVRLWLNSFPFIHNLFS